MWHFFEWLQQTWAALLCPRRPEQRFLEQATDLVDLERRLRQVQQAPQAFGRFP